MIGLKYLYALLLFQKEIRCIIIMMIKIIIMMIVIMIMIIITIVTVMI